MCIRDSYTIGDFAKLDRETAVGLFGTRGDTLWNYANGRESDPVTKQGSRDKMCIRDRLCAFAAMSPVQQATVEANGDAWCTQLSLIHI